MTRLLLTRRSLMRVIDGQRVREAIERAERRTSGEVRVTVSPFFWGNVRSAAELAFDRLGMTATKDRNGVLLFVVPSRRQFVVLGDTGIHERVGQGFWDAVAADMSAAFHRDDFTGGLVRALDTIGDQLSMHFPHEGAADRNELANDMDFGAD